MILFFFLFFLSLYSLILIYTDILRDIRSKLEKFTDKYISKRKESTEKKERKYIKERKQRVKKREGD